MKRILSLVIALAMLLSASFIAPSGAALNPMQPVTAEKTEASLGYASSYTGNIAQQQNAPQKEPTKSGRMLYGYVAWDSQTHVQGWASIDLNNPNTYTLMNSSTNIVYGAEYSVLHGQTFVTYTPDNNISFYFGTANPFTGEITPIKLAPEHCNSLCMDYTTGTMYALAVQTNTLYSVDVVTGDYTIAAILPMASSASCMAIDTEGNMFIIDSEGYLLKFDLDSNEITTIGNTGEMPAYAQGLTYNHDDDTLYWAQYGFTTTGEEGKLFMVDTNVAFAIYLGSINRAEITALHTYPTSLTFDNPVAATGIELSETEKTIGLDESFYLAATVLPVGVYVADRSVTYVSSDESVASVDEYGKVTGLKSGEVTITVTSTEGGFVATCNVMVSVLEEFYRPLSVALNSAELGAEGYYPFMSGDPYPFIPVEVDGRNAIVSTNMGIPYSTSFAQLIDPVFLTGGSTISFEYKASSSEFGDVVRLVVNDNIVFSKGGLTEWESFSYTVDATGEYNIRLEYWKDDIIDEHEDCGYFDNFAINVLEPDPIESIEVVPAEVNIIPGTTVQLNVEFTPVNILDSSVTFSSSDNAIATVNEDGLVSAVAPGTAIITVTANDGGHTDSATINVSENFTPADMTYQPISGGDNIEFMLNGDGTFIVDLGLGYLHYARGFEMNIAEGEGMRLDLSYAPDCSEFATAFMQIYDENFNLIVSDSEARSPYKFIPQTGGKYYLVTSIYAPYFDIGTKPIELVLDAVDYEPIYVSDITVTPETMELGLLRYNEISAVLTPVNTDFPDIEWSTSDESIVSIESDGDSCRLFGAAKGTATITATASGFTSTCVVTVDDPVLPEYDEHIYAYSIIPEVPLGQGFVKYDVNGSAAELELVTPANLQLFSAVCVDGLVYGYELIDMYFMVKISFVVIDINSLVIQRTDVLDGNLVCVDMSYDYLTDTIYGTAIDYETHENFLVTVDPNTGLMTQVAPFVFENDMVMQTISFDMSGNLFGIRSDGLYVSIDRATAQVTSIINLRYPMAYIQTLVYNPYNDIMYWFQCSSDSCNLIKFNPVTGEKLSEEPLGDGKTELTGAFLFFNFEIGDVNLDLDINTGDAAMLLRYAAKLDDLSEKQLSLGDYNNDGEVNTGDAAAILYMVAFGVPMPE